MISEDIKRLRYLAGTLDRTGKAINELALVKSLGLAIFGANYDTSSLTKWVATCLKDERRLRSAIAKVSHWLPEREFCLSISNRGCRRLNNVCLAIPELLSQLRADPFGIDFPCSADSEVIVNSTFLAVSEVTAVMRFLGMYETAGTNKPKWPDDIPYDLKAIACRKSMRGNNANPPPLSARDRALWEAMLWLGSSIMCVYTAREIATHAGYTRGIKRAFGPLEQHGYVKACRKGFYLTIEGIKQGEVEFSSSIAHRKRT